MRHESDLFNISLNVDTGIFTLHRQNSDNRMVDDVTFNMDRHEMHLLFESIMDIPEFKEKAQSILSKSI